MFKMGRDEKLIERLIGSIDRHAAMDERMREEEIEARDRVDISLKEYENTRATIENLQYQVALYSDFFNHYKLPPIESIDLASVEMETYREPLTQKTKCYIRFAMKGE